MSGKGNDVAGATAGARATATLPREAQPEPRERALPSFSIVIEPYNLRATGVERLRECLRSIAGEVPSPAQANEALLLDEGGMPRDVVRQLEREFPWLTLRPIPAGLGYGDVKAVGAAATTGEVVVMLDSDCVYENGWLRRLLEPLAADPACAAVTGETEIPARGLLGVAAAVLWVFPRFSGQRELSPTRFYAHPAALRREALERFPLPRGLPLVRAQAVVHSLALRTAGYTILRHPGVRTHHALPSAAALVNRFYCQGRDSIVLRRLTGDRAGHSFRGFLEPPARPVGRARHLFRRARGVLAEDPRRAPLLAAALPIVAVFLIAYFAGRLVSRLS